MAPLFFINSLEKISYSLGLVNTATLLKFFAAALTIVGPPISIFSIAKSKLHLGSLIVDSKGYKLTITRSISGIPFFLSVSVCFRLSL